MGRRKHKFNRIRHVAPLCPHVNRLSTAAIRPYVKLLDHLLLLLGRITVLRTMMQPIVTDRVVCRSVCRSVCLSVTVMSPAKMAEPIEMPFGLRTRLDQRNHVDGIQISPWEGAILGKRDGPLKSIWTLCGEPAKTAEPFEMPFGLWTRVGLRNYVTMY